MFSDLNVKSARLSALRNTLVWERNCTKHRHESKIRERRILHLPREFSSLTVLTIFGKEMNKRSHRNIKYVTENNIQFQLCLSENPFPRPFYIHDTILVRTSKRRPKVWNQKRSQKIIRQMLTYNKFYVKRFYIRGTNRKHISYLHNLLAIASVTNV